MKTDNRRKFFKSTAKAGLAVGLSSFFTDYIYAANTQATLNNLYKTSIFFTLEKNSKGFILKSPDNKPFVQ